MLFPTTRIAVSEVVVPTLAPPDVPAITRRRIATASAANLTAPVSTMCPWLTGIDRSEPSRCGRTHGINWRPKVLIAAIFIAVIRKRRSVTSGACHEADVAEASH